MKQAGLLEVVNITRQSTVCSEAQSADTLRQRLVGLLGMRELPREGGLFLNPSSGVHTFGMKFNIDVVALDRHLRVVGVWEAVMPGKVRGLGLRTHSILELHSGRARACGVAIGDQLTIQAAQRQAA